MQAPRTSFTFYRSYFEAIRLLKPNAQLALYNAIADYALNAELPVNLPGDAMCAFMLVKPSLDAGTAHWLGGRKGGRPRKIRVYETPTDIQGTPGRN